MHVDPTHLEYIQETRSGAYWDWPSRHEHLAVDVNIAFRSKKIIKITVPKVV
jgi:hypothetical protein